MDSDSHSLDASHNLHQESTPASVDSSERKGSPLHLASDSGASSSSDIIAGTSSISAVTDPAAMSTGSSETMLSVPDPVSEPAPKQQKSTDASLVIMSDQADKRLAAEISMEDESIEEKLMTRGEQPDQVIIAKVPAKPQTTNKDAAPLAPAETDSAAADPDAAMANGSGATKRSMPDPALEPAAKRQKSCGMQLPVVKHQSEEKLRRKSAMIAEIFDEFSTWEKAHEDLTMKDKLDHFGKLKQSVHESLMARDEHPDQIILDKVPAKPKNTTTEVKKKAASATPAPEEQPSVGKGRAVHSNPSTPQGSAASKINRTPSVTKDTPSKKPSNKATKQPGTVKTPKAETSKKPDNIPSDEQAIIAATANSISESVLAKAHAAAAETVNKAYKEAAEATQKALAIKKDVETQAAQVLADARARADETLAEAQAEADVIELDAGRRAQALLAKANRQLGVVRGAEVGISRALTNLHGLSREAQAEDGVKDERENNEV